MSSGSAMLIIVMCISTIAVSFLITKQNRTASVDLISKSFTIIREGIASNQKKLTLDTKQMATVGEMGTKIQFVATEKGNNEPSLTESTYNEIIQALYNVGISSEVQEIFAYDMEHRRQRCRSFSEDCCWQQPHSGFRALSAWCRPHRDSMRYL